MPALQNNLTLQEKRPEPARYRKFATAARHEPVLGKWPIFAELKTNVVIYDEHSIITGLSKQLAAQYQLPESSVCITIDHSLCVMMAGSFDAAYILNLGIPAQMSPTTHKRNAALLQLFLSETLSVPPPRGIIKFLPIMEENVIMSGTSTPEHHGSPQTDGLLTRNGGTKGRVEPSLRVPQKSSPEMEERSPSRSDRDRFKYQTSPSDTSEDPLVIEILGEKRSPREGVVGIRYKHRSPPDTKTGAPQTPRLKTKKSLLSVFKR